MSDFSHIIAIDFEATCGNAEIIEFPAVLINLKTGEIEEEFHKYVRPDNHKLSLITLAIVNIEQSNIDSASNLRQVLIDFDAWLRLILSKKSLKIPKSPKKLRNCSVNVNCAFVTWGRDMSIYLHKECIRKGIQVPNYFNYWINLQSTFMEKIKLRHLPSLDIVLKLYGMKFSGEPHCGIDDARNTAKLFYEMAKRGLKIFNVVKNG